MKNEIIQALKEVYDPDISVNVYDLGLIYSLEIDDTVEIKMTLTSPFCPVADDLIEQVRDAAAKTSGIETNVELTFDPPWNPELISDEGKLLLNLF